VPPCAKACKLNLPFGSRRGRASLGRDSSQAGQSGISSLFGLADLAFSCCISCRVGGVVCQSGGRAYALAGCALRNLSTLHSSPPKYGATCPRFPVSGNLQRCMPPTSPAHDMPSPTCSATRSDGAVRHERSQTPHDLPDDRTPAPSVQPTMSRAATLTAFTEAGGRHGAPRTNGGLQ
jgi:hypothetical protein